MQSMAAQEHESDAHYARSSHHTMEPKYVQQGARRSVLASAESLIVNAFVEDCDLLPRKDKSEEQVVFRRAGIPALDFEAQRPEALAGTDASRMVRFVGQDSKAALVMSHLCLPSATVSSCCAFLISLPKSWL